MLTTLALTQAKIQFWPFPFDQLISVPEFWYPFTATAKCEFNSAHRQWSKDYPVPINEIAMYVIQLKASCMTAHLITFTIMTWECYIQLSTVIKVRGYPLIVRDNIKSKSLFQFQFRLQKPCRYKIPRYSPWNERLKEKYLAAKICIL